MSQEFCTVFSFHLSYQEQTIQKILTIFVTTLYANVPFFVNICQF